jgi:hypothetical protein
MICGLTFLLLQLHCIYCIVLHELICLDLGVWYIPFVSCSLNDKLVQILFFLAWVLEGKEAWKRESMCRRLCCLDMIVSRKCVMVGWWC